MAIIISKVPIANSTKLFRLIYRWVDKSIETGSATSISKFETSLEKASLTSWVFFNKNQLK